MRTDEHVEHTRSVLFKGSPVQPEYTFEVSRADSLRSWGLKEIKQFLREVEPGRKALLSQYFSLSDTSGIDNSKDF